MSVIESFPTLYKRTSAGATQRWDISAEIAGHPGGGDFPCIVTRYGQDGGAIQQARVWVREGKNVGRSNETTPAAQAALEAASKWRKQKDKGYVETLDATALSAAIERRPMLAKVYDEHRHKISWPAIVQPKLDGIRCLAHKEGDHVTLLSRGNKAIETVPHINYSLAHLMKNGETWDGELYVHGVPFQEISSLVKREQAGSEEVEYHVYDAISPEDYATRAIRRFAGPFPNPSIRKVPSIYVGSHEEAIEAHNDMVSRGYEGAMVRHGEAPYKEGGRSDSLLKLKAFLDMEARIVGVKEGKGHSEGMAIFRLVTDRGVEFDCMPKGSEAHRRELWASREAAIGKMMTVKFFEWTTSEPPAPRFPVGIGIRWDLEES